MKPPADSTPTGASEPADWPEPIEQAQAAPIDSQQLLQGRKEVMIVHQGIRYRLQETRAGKLILIK